MRNIVNTFLLLFLFSASGIAQVTLSVSPENISADVGEQFKVNIVVDGYNNILSAGFKIKWDQSVMSYVDKGDFTPDLPNVGSSIGDSPNNINSGQIIFSFFDFTNFVPYTLADGTTIFSLTFEGAADGTTTIDFEDIEIVDEMEQTQNVSLNTGAVAIGTGTGGGGGNDNTDPVRVTAGSTTGEVGQQVCVPLQVSNFEEMNSMQFSVNYDAAVLNFDRIDNTNLAGLSTGSFGAPPNLAEGNVTLAWNDTSGGSTSVSDGTAIAQICFDLVAEGQSAIQITGSPLALDAVRSEAGAVGISNTNGSISVTNPNGGGGSSDFTFRITPSSNTVAVGENFTVDLIVDNYTDVLSAGFKITWNPNVLSYVDKSNILDQLPGLAGSIGDTPNNTDNGQIIFSYFDFSNFVAYTLPNNTRLFSMTFTGAANGTTSFDFIDVEIIDSEENPLSPMFEGGSFVVGDGSGGGNSDPVVVNVGTATGQNGQQICVPVTVDNFTDMESLQFSVNYNAAVVNFDAIQNLNLDGLAPANFGTSDNPNISEGTITMNWSNLNGGSTSVPNGTKIFDLCFTGVGSSGATTNVAITDSPAVKEGIRENVGEVTVNNNNGSITITGGGVSDNFELNASNITIQPNGSGCIDVTIRGFQDIVSLQYSMGWDSNILRFDQVNLPSNNPLNLQLGDNGNFRQTETNDGKLSVSWNDSNFRGITLDDNTILFSVCFDALGRNGQGSSFDFTDDPLTIEVINLASNEVQVGRNSGRITIMGDVIPSDCDANAFPVCIGKEVAKVGDEVCVGVTAENFVDLVGLQFTIVFDPNSNVASYDRVVSRSSDLPLNPEVNIVENPGSGTIGIRWDDQTLEGVTIPNGTKILDVCFTAQNEGVLPMTFQDFPIAREVIDLSFQPVEFNGSDGMLTVEAACTTPTISETITDVDCRGESTGRITLQLDGGDDDYRFTWSSNATNIPADVQSPSNLAAGNYNVTVTTCAGDLTRSFTISEPTDGITATANVTADVACFGENTGAIEISVTGGSGTLAYQWGDNNAINEANRSGLPAGDYAVTVTDANGCPAEVRDITIAGPSEALSVTVEKQDIDCADQASGEIELIVAGGTPDYAVTWMPANSGFTLTGLAPDTYNYRVTDANGCESQGSVNIRNIGTAIAVTDTLVNKIEDNNGAVTITVEGGDGAYLYTWSGPPGFNGSLSQNLTNLSIPGEYTVEIRDGKGCTTTETYLVPVPMSVADLAVAPACSGAETGSISLEIDGGFPPYTYLWDNAATSDDIDSLSAQNYILTVTDSKGETFVTEAITVDASPAINIELVERTPETCNDLTNDGSLQISVSGGVAPLSWSWADGFDNESMRTDLDNGMQVITATDDVGCIQIDSFEVEFEPGEPAIANLDIQRVTCDGLSDGSIAFDITCGEPSYVVSLTTSDTIIRLAVDEYNPRILFNELPKGTYELQITDELESVYQDEITIDAPESLQVVSTIFSSTEVFTPCNGQIRLNVTGGQRDYTYEWSHDASVSSASISGACPGEYITTVTDVRGCRQIDTINLTVLNANGRVTSPNCPTDDLTGGIDLEVQQGQPPYTFVWYDDTGAPISEEEDLSGVAAGIYRVEITERSGVTIERSFQITSASDLSVTASFLANYNGFGVSCNGSTDATIRAQGNNSNSYTYRWLTPAQDTVSGQVLENIGVGIYTAIVTDDEGCTSTSEIIVTQPPVLEVMSDVVNLVCNGDRSGEAEVIASGGAGDGYTYKWSNDPEYSFGLAKGLNAGDYIVTVTDANGCTIVDSFSITEPAPLVAVLDVEPFAIGKPGSVQAIVTGGSEPYTFYWFDSKGEQVSNMEGINNLKEEDQYRFVVEDINLCSDTLFANMFNLSECLANRSVLTPNGDGKNEFFEIRCLDIITEKRLEVYNRFGHLVFEMNDYDGSWDGRDMGGTPLPDGAYFYVLEYTDILNDNLTQQKGTVTILTE